MSYYIGPFSYGWDSLGCNCSSLKLLTLFLDLIDTCCSPWGEVDKSNGVIYLLMHKRVHIFLARSSGVKGFQKRSFSQGEDIFRCEFILQALFWACSHPFTLVFFFFKSLIAAELELHIGNANSVGSELCFQLEDLRAGSHPSQFSFTLL